MDNWGADGPEDVMANDTLPRMFWSRVETSGSLPAQMVRRGGQWRILDWSAVGEIVRELAQGLPFS